MSDEIPVVTDADVEAIRVQFQPGAVVPSSKLYGALSRLMHDQRRPLAHQTSFGHALRRGGWISHRDRRRYGGVQHETSCWVVPGAPPDIEHDEQVYATLRDLGPGIHSDEAVFERYQALTRKHGWRWTYSPAELSRWMTRHHFVRMQYKKQKCRFVGEERLIKIEGPR